jgi:hypothetical protein
MSVEERLLKLEEFASDVREYTRILTAMIRRHDERLDEQEARGAEHGEQLRILTQLAMRGDERGQEHDEQLRILTGLAVHADERLDNHDAEVSDLRAGESNADARIAALADAQIRTEDALKKLIERDDGRR